MVGLTDIADIKEKVTIRGKEIDVGGISAEGLGLLFGRFPEVKKAFGQRSASDINPSAIMDMAPTIIAAVIASGIGFPGDKVQEAFAKKLSIGDQMTLVSAIFKATFPRGIGNFVEELEQLGLTSLSKLADSGMAPDTISPSQSNGSSGEGNIPPK